METHKDDKWYDVLASQPKEGEWCWFWDEGDYAPRLGTYMYTKDNSKGLNPKQYVSYSLWESFHHCEPFIGNLPSFLKDN